MYCVTRRPFPFSRGTYNRTSRAHRSNYNICISQFYAKTVLSGNSSCIIKWTNTMHIHEDSANQVKVVSALKRKHKRVEYRARLTRNNILEALKTQVILILHTIKMARFDYVHDK